MSLDKISMDASNARVAAAALLLLGLLLGGCGSSLIDKQAGAAAPKTSGYLPVEDLPPDRDEAAMSTADRDKIKAELLAARDSQAAAAKAQGSPLEPMKP
jgi:hypothetical protein